MNAPEKLELPDIQAVADGRNVPLDRVGVRGLRHPVRIARPDGTSLPTVARVDMYVGLQPDVKGTHMSRFVEVLQTLALPLDFSVTRDLVQRMLSRLGATTGLVEFNFDYFIAKRAPVSGVESLLDYAVMFRGEINHGGYRFTVRTQVPVTSLCPCSKEISEYGAHNQRSHITISAELAAPMSIEELVGIAEREASCELYGLLKRSDEKYVTERAYDNPKFVEDLARDIALRLDGENRILSYVLESENFESIHNHSAYAMVQRSVRAGAGI
jgi:GTP cyclohydrolase I